MNSTIHTRVPDADLPEIASQATAVSDLCDAVSIIETAYKHRAKQIRRATNWWRKFQAEDPRAALHFLKQEYQRMVTDNQDDVRKTARELESSS